MALWGLGPESAEVGVHWQYDLDQLEKELVSRDSTIQGLRLHENLDA